MGQIISLKYDFSFKYLFLNEEVRRYFISDALGIPLEEIRSVRLANTFLWKQHQKQKIAYWGKRSLFYLSKLFTEGLLSGQKYENLKRCICISILGFNLDDGPEYHRIYRLRDETGSVFSDMLEIHVIELNKPLSGTDRMDDWIRLFNVRTREELEMLETKTKNIGILEAIKEVRVLGLGKTLRAIHDAKLKEIRDQWAREDYVRNEGVKQGRSEGEERFGRLYLKLIADKRLDDAEKAAKVKAYREQLYKEYGIF